MNVAGRRRRVAYVVLAVILTALVVSVLWSIFTTQDHTSQIRQAQKDSAALLRIVQDCTEPGGECFARQRQTSQARSDAFAHLVVLAVMCADRPGVQTADEIRACVLAAELEE